MKAAAAVPERAHFPALDGLRGAAILLVMVYHFTGGTDQAASGLDRWFSRVMGVGWCGVDLFFVLSGFLITGILFDSKGSRTGLRDFYAKRALRIWPLYYGVLLALFVLIPAMVGTLPGLAEVGPSQKWLWLYCGNIAKFFDPSVVFHAGSIQTKHFWSLAVEEQFYLVWPLIVFALRRESLMRWCVGVAAASAALRIGLMAWGGENAEQVYTFTPCRLEGLMAGGFVALAMRSERGLGALVPAAKWISIACGTLLAATWLVVGLDNGHWTMMTYGATVMALLFGALLVIVLAGPGEGRAGRLLRGPTLRFFGKYSYGLYVFHYLLSPVFREYVSAQVLSERVFGHYWPARIANVLVCFVVSIVVAWLSWHLMEKHFLKLKRYCEPRREAGAERKTLRVVVASSGLGHVARGVEAWALDLGHALHARGVNVLLCKGGGVASESFERVIPCWTRDSQAAKRVVRWLPGAIAWRLGLASGYGVEQVTFVWRLIGLLRREEIDVLHVQDPLVAAIVERSRRLGFVKTRAILAHGTEEPSSFLARLAYVQHLAPWHGEECRREGRWKSGWGVIPNFVDTGRFSPEGREEDGREIRRELGIPDDALVVLTAAAIKKKHKRVDALIDEVADVIASNPALPVWLVVAGGEERETAEVIEHGRRVLGERVRFLVRFPRARMAQLYKAADVFALASLKEMMPMAVLEAMGSGLPCVVNRHPVLEWMVGDGGKIIEMEKRGELARTLAELLSNRNERATLAARARARCVAEFGEGAVVDRIVRYYERIVPGGRASENVPSRNAGDSAAAARSWPGVSVVIPAYNSARWIDEAIESVLAQSVPPQEIIVVDDGSTDDTARRLERYRGRVVCIQQENQGVAAARNRGIAAAAGEWIAFLDADDVWQPQKLERQLEELADRPELAMLGTGACDWPGECGDETSHADVRDVSWDELIVRNRFTTSSVLVRRDVLERLGGFDPDLRGPEDYDLWLRLVEQYPAGVLQSPLVGYREVEGSLGRRAVSMEIGLERVLRKVGERGAWKGRWMLRRKSYCHWRYSCAYMYMAGGELRVALARLLKSFVLWPWAYRRGEMRVAFARARMLSMIVRRMLHVTGNVPRRGTVKAA